MRVRIDGSVQSSSTPTYQNSGRREDFALYRCMVVRVTYTDDPNNITTNSQNPRVLYDCVVLGGFAAGQKISNCRLASDLGGVSSFWERTLRASSKDISNTRLSDCDGDIVLVQFNQGHSGSPYIIALDQGINTAGLIGAGLSEGPRSLRQFNGVSEEINNAGELTLEVSGGIADSEHGGFTANQTPLVTFLTTKNEVHSRQFKSGLVIEENGSGDSVTIRTKKGTVISINGVSDSVDLTTSGGAKVSVNGKTGTVSAQDNGGGKLKISSGKVGLGTVSTELVDLVAQIADALSTTTAPGFGAPISSVATFAAIKAQLDSIKGGV